MPLEHEINCKNLDSRLVDGYIRNKVNNYISRFHNKSNKVAAGHFKSSVNKLKNITVRPNVSLLLSMSDTLKSFGV